MGIDIAGIVTMLDYFTRLINDLFNKILGMLGLPELTSNDYTFPAENDILNPNPNGVINR